MGFRLAVIAAGLWLLAAPAQAMSLDRAQQRAPVDGQELRCLALTLYWEARSEGLDGMRAVAAVVLNRVADGAFPDTVCDVMRQGGEAGPCQFSWWCDGKSDSPAEAEAWAAAHKVAREIFEDPAGDPTDGALFFHNVAVKAGWTKRLRRTVQIGRHVYYR